MKLIETTTALGGTLISLKDVGTDALFALQTVLRNVELERLMAFYERCRDERPRSRGRADRRQGRPQQGAARAVRP